jgi:hypothetical protein
VKEWRIMEVKVSMRRLEFGKEIEGKIFITSSLNLV